MAESINSKSGPADSSFEDDAVDLESLGANGTVPSEPASVAGETSHGVHTDSAQKTDTNTSDAPTDRHEKKNKELAQEVAGLKENLEGQKDKYLRLMAEFDNFKRRTGKEYERLIEQAGERLMSDIIEVRDNMDRALAAAKLGTDYPALLAGMEMIDGKLTSVLSKHGLSAFAVEGEEFNPELHEALMKQPHASIGEDHLAQVFEKGYMLKGKVIKHAKVVVSSGAPAPAVPKGDTAEDNSDEATFEIK